MWEVPIEIEEITVFKCNFPSSLIKAQFHERTDSSEDDDNDDDDEEIASGQPYRHEEDHLFSTGKQMRLIPTGLQRR